MGGPQVNCGRANPMPRLNKETFRRAADTPGLAPRFDGPSSKDSMSDSGSDTDDDGLEVVESRTPRGDTAVSLVATASRSPSAPFLSIGTHLTPSSVPDNHRRTSHPTPRVGHYRCATQQRANATARARVGHDGYIPRWQKGSTIKYIVREESFSNHRLATFTAAKAVEATFMWRGIGVRFEQVYRDREATFQIKYRDSPSDYDPKVFAEAFFPHEWRGTLFVYRSALEEGNRDYLANILAHELGHILGLRHEFAGDVIRNETGETREAEAGSVPWGSKNENSIMNYFASPGLCSVQEQDLEELREFYDFSKEMYKGLRIRDFEPRTFPFSPARRHCQCCAVPGERRALSLDRRGLDVAHVGDQLQIFAGEEREFKERGFFDSPPFPRISFFLPLLLLILPSPTSYLLSSLLSMLLLILSIILSILKVEAEDRKS
ncbi:hypothetical protein F5Y14DRAFT_292281 [Nemania sp. NC0429]|nr:hypothetical protein F5Y14DRAFT_292281 [Nemania sp. NC0429]